MDKYTATELAFKNGYEKGYEAGKKDAVKWIPVSERLPTEEDANEDGCVLVAYRTAVLIETLDWYDVERYSGMVSCWMPLPEPPNQ